MTWSILVENTFSNYAQLLTAMKWLHDRKSPVFQQLGYCWTDFLDHFKIGMTKTIASFHVSLSNPESVVRSDIKLIRYLVNAFRSLHLLVLFYRVLVKSWPLYERKRALAIITCSEKKISSRRALAVRQSEKRFRAISHIRMDLVKKMVTVQCIGGLVDQDCTAFLSDRSEDDEVELGINSQRHMAMVVRLTALKSRDITDLSDCEYL